MTDDISTLFRLPLSDVAHEQYSQLIDTLQSIPRTTEKDSWTYIWNKEAFIPAKAYQAQIDNIQFPASFTWLWASYCQLKHKFFFWLLLIDRLNTRAMFQKRQFHVPSYDCVLCGSRTLESRDHLFYHCPFAKADRKF